VAARLVLLDESGPREADQVAVHLSDRHAALRRKRSQGYEPSKCCQCSQNFRPDFNRLNARPLVVGLIVLLGFRFYVHRLPFMDWCKGYQRHPLPSTRAVFHSVPNLRDIPA
jgi:hypothetical protein